VLQPACYSDSEEQTPELGQEVQGVEVLRGRKDRQSRVQQEAEEFLIIAIHKQSKPSQHEKGSW